MNVLVYIENEENGIKKSSLEALNYGSKIAGKTGGDTIAFCLDPDAEEDRLNSLGQYGADRTLHATDEKLKNDAAQALAKITAQVADDAGANIVIFSNDYTGKALAPRVAARMKAGFAPGAVEYPQTGEGFLVKRSVFSGKAFAYVELKTDKKVISLMPNTYPVEKIEKDASVEKINISADEKDFNTEVIEVNKITDEIPLTEAELVVSGGRGLKGPENWGMIEDLADTLGAATACSRPVADSEWRPHEEHVGQTGTMVRPNLYIAIAISGAIQHLAGVNQSKNIVVINKDPEAPFFKAADYGIVGDAFEVVPKLTEAIKKFKQSTSD